MKKSNDRLIRKGLQKQKSFLRAIEGLGDILVYNTEKHKNSYVIDYLAKITSIYKKTLERLEEDPENYQYQTLSHNFIEEAQENESNIHLKYYFNPKEYLVSYSALLEFIHRIYNSSISVNNSQISYECLYTQIRLLSYLTRKEGRQAHTEIILNRLYESLDLALTHEDSSAAYASVFWYTNIVYSLSRRDNGFKFEYLKVFNDRLFASFQRIISSRKEFIYNSVYSALNDHIHIDSTRLSHIWDYGHLILDRDIELYNRIDEEHSIEKTLRELSNPDVRIVTIEQFEKWSERFETLQDIVKENISDDQCERERSIKDKVQEELEANFLHNNLINMVLRISAYCLFTNNFIFLADLWNYRQPPDAEAINISHNIIPEDIDEVISLMFIPSTLFDRHDRFENHHGSKKYYRQLVLILFARAIKSLPEVDGSRISQIRIPRDVDVFSLSHAESSIDEFINEIPSVIGYRELFSKLGFAENLIDDIVNRDLGVLFEKIKIEVSQRIEKIHIDTRIDAEKKMEFIDSFLEAYKKSAQFRELLEKTSQVTSNRRDIPESDEIVPYGINTLLDKAVFFKDWHIHFAGWGDQFGNHFGQEENHKLAAILDSACKETKGKDLHTALEEIEDKSNVIVISTGITFHQQFGNASGYLPAWRINIQGQVSSFHGFYTLGENQIPLYTIHLGDLSDYTYILDKRNIGLIEQYDPSINDANDEVCKGSFSFQIIPLDENDAEREKLLSASPEWLQKHGDIEAQTRYLKKNCSLQIFEKFEFKINESFKGLKLRAN